MSQLRAEEERLLVGSEAYHVLRLTTLESDCELDGAAHVAVDVAFDGREPGPFALASGVERDFDAQVDAVLLKLSGVQLVRPGEGHNGTRLARVVDFD